MFAQLVFGAVVRVDQGLAGGGVALEGDVGAQQGAKLAQEGGSVVEELAGWQVHHKHQDARCQTLRYILGTVQPVPATLGTVAALIAVAVRVVVLTVLIIQGTRDNERNRISGILFKLGFFDIRIFFNILSFYIS